MTLVQRGVYGAVGVLVLITTYGMGFLKGHGQGAEKELAAAMKREADVSLVHAQAYRSRDAQYRAAEGALRAEADLTHDSLMEVLNDEKTQHDRLVAGLRARVVRLSIPVVAAADPGATCGATVAGDSPPAAGDRHEARAELEPAAAETLVAIVSDGNAAIHQANACIDRYEGVRRRLNALRREQLRAQTQ